MTILAFDLKILAADTLFTAGNVKVYHKSKIRIIKQHAIASTGLENDGFRFEKWFFEQSGEDFICEDHFAAFVLGRDKIFECSTINEDYKLGKLRRVNSKVAMGTTEAMAAAEILMRISKVNAHNAAVAAANYHTHCGPPVYSITKKQLEYIHADFTGYWVGNYKVPASKIKNFLITEKEWLKIS